MKTESRISRGGGLENTIPLELLWKRNAVSHTYLRNLF